VHPSECIKARLLTTAAAAPTRNVSREAWKTKNKGNPIVRIKAHMLTTAAAAPTRNGSRDAWKTENEGAPLGPAGDAVTTKSTGVVCACAGGGDVRA